MRLIVMYDINMSNEDNIKKYNKFLNFLNKSGYFRIQYSVYCKCINAHTMYKSEKIRLLQHVPVDSNVRVMLITENQYQDIELLSGKISEDEYLQNQGRFIRL
ncbi:CRISPR-associated endonuclease Cas2 [Metamycoplasma equirhinis]|uniref:CRISPR-associated endonuclease Cas2 n=1 Tax=Metamycoplasma equirhinis TaxID=92402 RepID=UPI0035948FC9